MKTYLKWAIYSCFGLVAVVILAGAALFFVAKATLAPLPDEWTTELGVGPVRVQAGVPSLIRLGTAPWFARLLDGRSVPTRAGVLRLRWTEASQTLTVRCTPCELQGGRHGGALGQALNPVLGDQALQIDDLQFSIRRVGMHLSGELRAGALTAPWKGELQRQRLTLQLDLAPVPMAHVYALFAYQIPELSKAQIEGTFAMRAQLSLPTGSLQIVPQIEGFRVSGLGTEALVNTRSSCGRSSRLNAESWLARAVIAAEDQRFFEHTGFDLVELTASFAKNQRASQIARGGSTLSQQLAKLLVTGDARSPVRKLRELLYAVEMEDTLGKARILRLYLDNAPWGPGLCGAEGAAQHYFGVSARKLEAHQAVWLAAMLHNPGAEAERWARSGEINMERAQWVAKGLRTVPRAERQALADSLLQVQWNTPPVKQ